MQRCEGDCDRGQCAPGLSCYQRTGNGNPPPGCKGPVKTSWDYCVKCDESKKTVNKGRDYRGCINMTKNNVQCRRWSQRPSGGDGWSKRLYPSKGLGDHNMCRNPDNSSGGIWCYQTTGARWGYC